MKIKKIIKKGIWKRISTSTSTSVHPDLTRKYYPMINFLDSDEFVITNDVVIVEQIQNAIFQSLYDEKCKSSLVPSEIVRILNTEFYRSTWLHN